MWRTCRIMGEEKRVEKIFIAVISTITSSQSGLVRFRWFCANNEGLMTSDLHQLNRKSNKNDKSWLYIHKFVQLLDHKLLYFSLVESILGLDIDDVMKSPVTWLKFCFPLSRINCFDYLRRLDKVSKIWTKNKNMF